MEYWREDRREDWREDLREDWREDRKGGLEGMTG